MKNFIKIIIIIVSIFALIMIWGLWRIFNIYQNSNEYYKNELNKSNIIKENFGEIKLIITNSNTYGIKKDDKFYSDSIILISKKFKINKIKINYLYKENVPCYVINKKEKCEVNESFNTIDYIDYIENNEYDIKLYGYVNRYKIKETASNLWNIIYSLKEIDYKNIETFTDMENIETFYDIENQNWYVKGLYKNELYNVIINNKEYKVLAMWKEQIKEIN